MIRSSFWGVLLWFHRHPLTSTLFASQHSLIKESAVCHWLPLAATLMAARKPEALWWAMVGIRSVKSVKNLIENNKCVYKK